MQKGQAQYIAQKTLLERGWTKSMIGKLLPEPITKPNPIYASASPMKLWKETDVLAAEQTELFEELLQKAQKRSMKAKDVAAQKSAQLMSELLALAQRLPIEKLSDKELRRETIDAKYDFVAWRANIYGRYDDKFYDFEHADETTMRRWIVNYIRHNLVDYDEMLYQYKGKVGIVKSYPEFKAAVLKRIAEVYPDYADECEIQIERCKALAEWRQQ